MLIEDGTVAASARAQREECAARRRLACAQLGETACHGRSAFNLWLPLPPPWRSQDFATEARRNGVAVTRPSPAPSASRATRPCGSAYRRPRTPMNWQVGCASWPAFSGCARMHPASRSECRIDGLAGRGAIPYAGRGREEGSRRMGRFGAGQPMRRVEDQRFLTGTGRYTSDIDLPDQAAATVVRSPFGNARILGIDTEAARLAPGVLGVFTAADLDADGVGDIPVAARLTSRDGSPMRTPRRPCWRTAASPMSARRSPSWWPRPSRRRAMPPIWSWWTTTLCPR